MVYYDRTDVFEDVDVNQIGESKECNICHHWYFLIKGFRFHLQWVSGCIYDV